VLDGRGKTIQPWIAHLAFDGPLVGGTQGSSPDPSVQRSEDFSSNN
jgi:hypothetical protein